MIIHYITGRVDPSRVYPLVKNIDLFSQYLPKRDIDFKINSMV